MNNKAENTNEDLQELLDYASEKINENYPQIHELYSNQFGDPELDPLRIEICRCLIFDLNQAAITLTNHFLEYLLKYALNAKIIRDKSSDDIDVNADSITHFCNANKEGNEKYGNKTLDTTINVACSQNIITKEQKKKLLELKNQFRNAYGHANKSEIFGDTTIPVTGITFTGDGKIKSNAAGNPRVADFPIAQGIIQHMMAKKDALLYFTYIDRLTREIKKKIYGEK